MTDSECPECPEESGPAAGPYAYAPIADTEDAVQRSTRPNCRYKQSYPGDDAWCKAGPVFPLRKQRITDALNRMAALGGVCADLASLGQTLLSSGWLRVYNRGPNTSYAGGGFAPLGAGSGGYLLLDAGWTDFYYDQDKYAEESTYITGAWVTVKRNLQYALAHELDHLRGRQHLDLKSQGGKTYLTENSILCGGNQ